VTLKMLDNVLEKAGVQALDPAGVKFNPEFHEAMVTQPPTGSTQYGVTGDSEGLSAERPPDPAGAGHRIPKRRNESSRSSH